MKRFIFIGILLLAACATPTTPPSILPTPAQPTETVEFVQDNLPSATPTVTAPPLEETEAGPTNTPEASAPDMPPTQSNAEAVVAFPDPANYQWVEVASGFQAPLYLTSAGDGSGRLFVVSQYGQIEIISNGQRLSQPFLDISDRTSRLQGRSERGLLGLAFHPRYIENGYFYVNYTDQNGNTRISRFSVSEQDPDRADPSSEIEILYIGQPYPNHNGGGLVFGPDGYLYIALGDGGSAGDPQGNGQSLNTMLGKILRIDVDTESAYAIPADNPFVDRDGMDEIWAYGLRNPWRIAFDQLTGDLYIADVGQNQYEEVNFQLAGSPGGQNYGWNYREGLHSYEGTPPAGLVMVEPVAEYSHALGCSVTGGAVYHGLNFPDWHGVYLYGDYCTGRVWGLVREAGVQWQSRLLFETGFTISSFGLDDQGELYVIDYNRGSVFRLDQR